MTKDYRRELQGLLRKLFQFDSADLDFGIYRIMNYKRDEIEKFIEEDLIKAVDVEFEKYSAKSKAEIEKELEEITKRISSTLGEDALLPSGDIKEMYRGSPIAKEFYKKKEDLKNSEMADQHKAEIFSHIYQFFSRYYNDGDFISQRRYSKANKYAIPYNGEEVLLHWANKDQYYIKTGEYFKNYSFKIGEYKVNFRLMEAETNKNNNRGENRFFLLNDSLDNLADDENAKELIIFFEYRALTEDEIAKYSLRDVQKKILEEGHERIIAKLNNDALKRVLLKQEGERTILEKHLFRYTKRNTTDYFIHKNLGVFLSGELDFYIKNEILIIDDLGSEKENDLEEYIGRIKVVKSISLKIIEFLAQIEDFQKKLFEKKKFIVKSDYCMTMDRIPIDFYDDIIENASQLNAWKELSFIGNNQQTTLSAGNTINVEFLKEHPYLVLDTKFFPQTFKDRLLSTFEDLDETIGGIMIKSENWQALNLLQERYQGMVKCIYIDPPYNTGNDDFIYKDGYQNSSWLSLIRDRLKLAGKFLSRAGSHASTIDKNEDAFLRLVHDDVFGEKNFIATIAWQKLYTIKNSAKYLSEMYDSIIIYSRDIENWLPNLIPRSEDQDEVYGNPDNDPNGPWISNALQARNYYGSGKYSIQCPGGRFIEGPPQGTYWRLSEANFKELDRQGRVWWGKNKNSFPRIKKYLKEIKEGVVPVDFWLHQFAGTNAESKTETRQLIGSDVEGLTPKPVLLLKRLVSMNADKDSIIMDYFAGSGTTAQAILDLNYDDNGMRKYILIEMGEFFDTVMKPRIEKVMYSKDWKDGRPSSCNGASHMFKYIYMEQYEDTLNNIEFLDSNKSVQKTLKDLDGYFLRYMLDFETRGSSCRLNVDQLSQPFKYTLNITRNNETRDEAVDLVETFNYLLGLSIKRIKAFNNNGSYYKAVLGTKGEETAAIIWRSIEGLDLEVDKEFIENYILKDFKANKVYVNSDCFVEGVIPIEPEFKRLMGA